MAGTTDSSKKNWVTPSPLGEELDDLRADVEAALEALLDVSAIEDQFSDSEIPIIGPNPWKWSRLADEHLHLLTAGRDLVKRWLESGSRIIRLCAPEFLQDFEEGATALRRVTDRSRQGEGPPSSELPDVLADVRQALADQREALRHAGVSATAPRELLLVPDTSALYANPALEEWASTQPATLVLVPQVIRELDKHKTHHPAEEVRKKAVSLIKRFENIGARGDTFDGVKLAGKLSFRELPADTDREALQTGLVIENDDDLLLGSALELKWATPSAAVVLVTADRNMRNKARMMRLTVDEPPRPSAPQAAPARPKQGRRPEVAIGHAGGQISTTPLTELKDGEKSRLTRVDPRYPIENKGATGIWNVTTGVRTHDGREHAFEAYKAQLIGAGETSWVENVGSIPLDFLEGTHQSAAFDAYIFWARFTDADGVDWEAAYDAGTRTMTYKQRS